MNKVQCHFKLSLLVPVVLTSWWGLLMVEDQHLELRSQTLQIPHQPTEGAVSGGHSWAGPGHATSDSKPSPRARVLLLQEHLIA